MSSLLSETIFIKFRALIIDKFPDDRWVFILLTLLHIRDRGNLTETVDWWAQMPPAIYRESHNEIQICLFLANMQGKIK